MSRKPFTDEEILLLRQNPYTYSVTTFQLNLTKEFKEIFYSEYQKGELPGRFWRITAMTRPSWGSAGSGAFPATSGNSTTNTAVSTKGAAHTERDSPRSSRMIPMHLKKKN